MSVCEWLKLEHVFSRCYFPLEAALAVVKRAGQEVGVVRAVVSLWTTNCYGNSISIFILAIVQYLFKQKY